MQEPLNYKDAVYNLQKYLRAISYVDSSVERPPVDGIFDVATARSVASFQESRGLNANGVADRATWDAIYKEYKRIKQSPPSLTFNAFIDTGYSVGLGEKSVLVSHIQVILRELGSVYDGFDTLEITGVFDEATELLVKELQRASLLEATGRVDAETYRRLLYDLSSHSPL